MIRELIDTELEAVAGGHFDSFNHVLNVNYAPQFSQAFGGNANNGSIGGSALSFNVGPTQTNQTQIGG
jgi:hypothetical protein